ncbi:hypothetical protein EET67_14585 [Pseudaminobacter arsenicus]|uniref:Uncharacterized protein n=1 Tax=Borborobacter arsenicus TaxID=1851146 RepID=A0A432V4M7_9HYPH|nr:hypothetical protein [Pseudaminobacter arsenicus]RUM97091.1 hypothetical protein EET67_14585 [Pseudaminobacter arsenicus]
MTSEYYTAYLEDLGSIAREASIAEEQFRKQAALRAEELKTERAFAFRRLNLVKAIGRAVSSAENEEDALKIGRNVFFREVSWNGATQKQKEVADQFDAVVLAIWSAVRPAEETDEQPLVGDALAAFEKWYGENRNTAFLNLMEREIVELPLVEI